MLLARDFSQNTSICVLDPVALSALMHLASWSGIWNMAGRIPKDIAADLLGRHVRTGKTRRRVLKALTSIYMDRWPACLLDAGDDYLVNPEIISYVRVAPDWDRSDVAKVIARDKSTCRYCGCNCIDDLSIDHVFPRSRGGSDKAANLVVACVSCNSRKSDRTPEESGMPLLQPAQERA